MSATATRRRRAVHHEEEHENEERWLVSFADMMTLLFCLFMVLFAISSVNTSKFESLQRSLQEAFSGKVLPGGQSVLQRGGDARARQAAEVVPPTLAVSPAMSSRSSSAEARTEQRELEALKRRVDTAAAQLQMRDVVTTTVADRGLVVRLRTDGVLFAPGSAALRASAAPVIGRLGRLLSDEAGHPLVVEGYTDATRIATAQFPSNWELSGARASSVMRALLDGGMTPPRDRSVRGFADRHPVASNATASGRRRNRRVEIVLTRLHSRRSP